MSLFKRKFQFADREVIVDFKKQIVTTTEDLRGDETASFKVVMTLFDCINKLDTGCNGVRFGMWRIDNIDGNEITDDLEVTFGCQTGTYGEIKTIIDYIKAGPTFYNFIYG